MTQFRADNTDGYDAAELAELNAAWTRITSHGAPLDSDDIAIRSTRGSAART
jgi:hypothetical protein